jgi:hypothetical protein
MDSQADLFSFNFLGYSGSFVLDQQGKAHLTTLQALDIELQATRWKITTPDGSEYLFEAMELTQPATAGGVAKGVSAWYLTRITTRFGKQVDFEYGDYTASYAYATNLLSTEVNPLPNATVRGTYHSCANLCECGTGANGWWAYDRPGVAIQGKYLLRITCSPTRMEFFSSAGRTDGSGLRQLDSVQVNYLPNPNRFKRFRMRYAYLSDRLALRLVQEVGRTDAGFLTAPPHRFFYHDNARSGNTAPGSPSIDRWGYFNGKDNKIPFLPYKDLHVDLAGANRDVDTSAVTFGLLRRIVYPTGGTTDFVFESNDFSNVNKFSYDLPRYYDVVCAANPDPTTNQPSCGNLSQTKTIRLARAQRVTFEWGISGGTTPDENNEVSTDLDVYGSLTDSSGVCARCPSIQVFIDRSGKPMPISAFLDAGTYYLEIHLTTSRYIQANLSFSYVPSFTSSFRGYPGGGTRIKRITTYDGLNHQRDLVKEYYYRDDANTHSTGKLTHHMAFASWVDKWTINHTSGHSRCRYLERSAQDVIGGSGTGAPVEVGYDTVTVVQRGNGQVLKSRSIFTNQAPSPVSLGDNESILPGTGSSNAFEQNGRLLSELAWQVRAGGSEWRDADCHLVKRLDNFYKDSITYTGRNLAVGGRLGQFSEQDIEPCIGISSQFYLTDSYWSPLVKRIETNYSQQDHSHVATITRWGYKRPLPQQPTWEERKTSSGGSVLWRFKYPSDYASPVTSATLLKEQYLPTTSLEQQQWQRGDSTSAFQWTGGTITSYAAANNGAGAVPKQVYRAALAVPYSSVQEARNASGAFTSLVSDPAYEPRAAYTYHGSGELAEQQLTGQPPLTSGDTTTTTCSHRLATQPQPLLPLRVSSPMRQGVGSSTRAERIMHPRILREHGRMSLMEPLPRPCAAPV